MRQMISVIVPIYNGRKYLDDCIQSILKSSYNNLDILLVDDGSLDDSLEICQKYAREDSRIKVLHQENWGVSAARNYGLREAGGDYISFVDCDDLLHKEAYALLMQTMTEAIDIVQFGFIRQSHDGRIVSRLRQSPGYWKPSDDLLANYLFPRKPAGIWSKFYRTSRIRNKQGKLLVAFDESIGVWEDLLFNCQYMERCEGGAIQIKEELYCYRMYDHSVSREAFSRKQMSIIYIFEKIFAMCQTEETKQSAKLIYCELLVKTLRRAYANKENRDQEAIDQLYGELKKNFRIYIKNQSPSFAMKLCTVGMQVCPNFVCWLVDNR